MSHSSTKRCWAAVNRHRGETRRAAQAKRFVKRLGRRLNRRLGKRLENYEVPYNNRLIT